MRYDTDQKWHYRRVLWTEISNHWREYVDDGPDWPSIFILDTAPALETEYLVGLGVPECAIHVCNDNPAHVASVKKRFRGVHTHGVDAGRAFADVAGNGGSTPIINLDFCGNISRELLAQLHAMGRSGVLPVSNESGALFAVTLLSGRESPSITSLMSRIGEKRADQALDQPYQPDSYLELSKSDKTRLALVVAAAGFRPRILQAWKYQSISRQPMLVALFSALAEHPDFIAPPRSPKRGATEQRLRDHQRACDWWMMESDGVAARKTIRRAVDQVLMSRPSFSADSITSETIRHAV